MDAIVETLSAELRDELVASNVRRLVDPRGLPMRFSWLKAISQSPAHALHSVQDDRDETLAIRLGSGTHALCFGKPVAIWDRPAKTGKGKAPRNGSAWDEFQAEHAGAVILNRKEHDSARRVADAIRSNRFASELLFAPGVIHEETILWTQDGRSRRTTPDAYGSDYVTELKTTRCAEPHKFARDGRFRGYHVQLADQGLAIEAKTGWKPLHYYIVSVETTKPYVVHVQELTERAIARGEELARAWFLQFRACEDAGKWPGYAQEITSFDVPEDDTFLPTPLVFDDASFEGDGE